MPSDFENRVFCPVCLEDYDEMNHIPRFLTTPGCGHSICSSCLPSVLKHSASCVLCRVPCCPNLHCKPINRPLIEACRRLKDLKAENKEWQELNKELAKNIKYFESVCGKLTKEDRMKYGEEEDETVSYCSSTCEEDVSDLEELEFQQNAKKLKLHNWQFHEAILMINKLIVENRSLELEHGILVFECSQLERKNADFNNLKFEGKFRRSTRFLRVGNVQKNVGNNFDLFQCCLIGSVFFSAAFVLAYYINSKS